MLLKTYCVVNQPPSACQRSVILSVLNCSVTLSVVEWMVSDYVSAQACSHTDFLRRIPARVRFISAEPLLGGLESLQLQGIDWLIVG